MYSYYKVGQYVKLLQGIKCRLFVSSWQAACWSPDGRTLLFATENEPIIYSLTFSTNIDDTSTVIGGSQSAVVSVSLAEVDLKTEDGETTK